MQITFQRPKADSLKRWSYDKSRTKHSGFCEAEMIQRLRDRSSRPKLQVRLLLSAQTMKLLHANTILYVLIGEILFMPVAFHVLHWSVSAMRLLFLFSAAAMWIVYFFIYRVYPKLNN
jgi:hypothetical protein